jgi:hypothetical protein
MTQPYREKIILRYLGPESLSSPGGRIQAEALIAGMEAAEVPGPPVSLTLKPDCIEASTLSVDDVERRLRASGRNREGGEWYLDVEPMVGNLPPLAGVRRDLHES